MRKLLLILLLIPSIAIAGGGLVSTDTDIVVGNIMFTKDGGIAVKMTNKTGGATVKGYVVAPYDAGAVDGAFALVGATDDVDPIGVIYQAGVADGSSTWVVISGRAYVYFFMAATRGHFMRTGVGADSGETAGQLASEAVPSSPFATDKHFQECGHVLETTGGAGLALCVVHFN